MTILWNLPNQGGYTGDILEKYENPKPAYTTLATFLKILTNKGYVKCRKKGSKLYYQPSVSQQEYASVYLAPVKDTFFHGSTLDMMRFMLSHEALSDEEIQGLIDIIHQTQGK
jgi:predicted transcriptional regulator